jgi:hypothetical protein
MAKAQLSSDALLVITNCTRNPYTRPIEPNEIKKPEHTMMPGQSCTIRKGFHDVLMKASRPYAALIGQRKLVLKEAPELVESPEQLHNSSDPKMPEDLKTNPVMQGADGPKEAVADTKDVTLVDAPDADTTVAAAGPTTAPPASSRKRNQQDQA